MTAALVAIAGPPLAALAVACASGAPGAPAAPTAAPTAALTKAELRPVLKAVVPALAACVDPDAPAGVVELALTITSDARGTTIAVDDVQVTGPLAAAPRFRGCAATALTTAPAPRLDRPGRATIRYPVTFDPRPPDNRDAALVDAADRAEAIRLPYGFDPAVWKDIVEQAVGLRAVFEGTADDESDEAIEHQARDLRSALRPLV